MRASGPREWWRPLTHPRRFAQFFIKPLFTESATEREMQAVHNGKHACALLP